MWFCRKHTRETACFQGVLWVFTWVTAKVPRETVRNGNSRLPSGNRDATQMFGFAKHQSPPISMKLTVNWVNLG